MKLKSESEVAQSRPIFRDPLDCSLLGSSVHGIFQARVLEWVAIAVSTYMHLEILSFLYVYFFVSECLGNTLTFLRFQNRII